MKALGWRGPWRGKGQAARVPGAVWEGGNGGEGREIQTEHEGPWATASVWQVEGFSPRDMQTHQLEDTFFF